MDKIGAGLISSGGRPHFCSVDYHKAQVRGLARLLISPMSDLVGSCPLEIVNLNHPRGPFRCAVFDFDGTLSLLRGNWQGLMVPMMVETLAATGTCESLAELTT